MFICNYCRSPLDPANMVQVDDTTPYNLSLTVTPLALHYHANCFSDWATRARRLKQGPNDPSAVNTQPGPPDIL